MLILVLALAVSGTTMAAGSEAAEELHEVLAYGLLGVGIAHLVGVAWHAVRHRENLVRSMVDGRKAGAAEDGIISARPLAALVFVGMVAGTVGAVGVNYDSRARTLTVPLLGRTLSLGEQRSDGDEAPGGEHRDRDHEEKDRHH
jgi:hypothetical protein